MKKRKRQIVKQSPWVIETYSNIHNEGDEDEFDSGFMVFHHKATEKLFKKEMAWFKGEGPYAVREFKPPTPIDIWDILHKYTPGTTGFIYKDWHIKRDQGCFDYLLIDSSTDPPTVRYKNIIADWAIEKQDFASFIEMLDNIQKQKDVERGEENKSILNLDEARLKKNA